MNKDNKSSSRSVDRALNIIEALASSELPLSSREISIRLDIPHSTLFEIMNVLTERGYIRKGEGKYYSISSTVIDILLAAVRNLSRDDIIRSVLSRITKTLGETSVFLQRDGDYVQFVEQVRGTYALVPSFPMGQRVPLYMISAGKNFLAEMPQAELDEYLSKTRLVKSTDRTLVDQNALCAELDRVRQTDVAYSREEWQLGVAGVSIGVRNNGKLVGTIGVVIAAVRESPELKEAIEAELRRAARSVTQAMHLMSLHD